MASVGRNEKIFIFFERDRKNEKKRKKMYFREIYLFIIAFVISVKE